MTILYPEELSEREQEILRLVATGASNKEIANRLVISPNTVKVHLRNIFGKIGAASRTEAAMYAIHNGLVEVPPSSFASTGLDSPVSGSGDLLQTSVVEIQPNSFSIDAEPTTFQAIFLRFIRRQALFLLVLVLLIGLVVYEVYSASTNVPPVEPPQATVQVLDANDRWHQFSKMAVPREKLAAAVYEGSIYAIGGLTGSEITAVVEKFNTGSNEWTQVADKPLPAADIQAAILEDKIYVPGGRTADETITARMEIYDPLNDAWEPGADLPKPISAYSLVAFEGKLFLFGGWDGKAYLSEVYVYDPAVNTWEMVSKLESPRAYSAAVVIGNQIYIIGGYNGVEAFRTILSFRPNQGESGMWDENIQMPAGRYAMGVASLADSMYIFGGKTNQGETLTPWQYDPQSLDWYTFDAPVQGDWSHLAAIPLQNLIYLIGGNLLGVPSAENLAFQAIYTLSVPLIR